MSGSVRSADSSSTRSSSFSSLPFLPSSSRSILDHFSSLYHLPKSIAELEALQSSASSSSSSSSSSTPSRPSSSSSRAGRTGIPVTPEVMETVQRDSESMFSPWVPERKEKGKKKKTNRNSWPNESDAQTNGNPRRMRSSSSSTANTSRNTSPPPPQQKRNPSVSVAPAATRWEEERGESEKERDIFLPNKRRLSAQNEAEILNALAGLKADKSGSKRGGTGEKEDGMNSMSNSENGGEESEEKPNKKNKKKKGAGRGRSKSVVVTSMPACPPTPPPTPLQTRTTSENEPNSKPDATSAFPGSASFQRRFSMPSHMYYFSFDDEAQRKSDATNTQNQSHQSTQQQINGTPNETTPLLSTAGEENKNGEQQHYLPEHHMSKEMMKEIQEKVKALKLRAKKAKKERQSQPLQQQQQQQLQQEQQKALSSKKRRYSLPSAVDEWNELALRVYGSVGNEQEEQEKAKKGQKNDVATQTDPSASWLDEEIRQLVSSSAKNQSQAHNSKPSALFSGPIHIESFESSSRQPQSQPQQQQQQQEQPEQQQQQPQRRRPLLTECSLPHFAPSSSLSFDAPTYSSLQNQRRPQPARRVSMSNWSVPAMAQRGNYERKKELERRYSMVGQTNANQLSQKQQHQHPSDSFSLSSSSSLAPPSSSIATSTSSASAPASVSNSRRNSQTSFSTSGPSNPYVSIDALIKLAHRKDIESRYSARPLNLLDRERRRSAIYELEKEIEKEANLSRKHTGLLSELFNSYQRNRSRPHTRKNSQSMDPSLLHEKEGRHEQDDELVVWPNNPRTRKGSLVSNRKRGEPVLSSSRRERLARLDAEEAANGQ